MNLYTLVKVVHVTAALMSGSIFLVRGASLNAGAGWPMAAPVRYATYAIDSVLLAAAIGLMTLLHQYPFANTWLTVKVLLVLAYIVLGTMALKRGKTRQVRVICYVMALIVFGYIVSVARAHSPFGLFVG